MERLTNHFDYCKMIDCKFYDPELFKQSKCKFFDISIQHCHEKRMNDKLREYEDAEEQGLLIRLPCKVGDKVYAITTCKDFGKVLDGTLWDAGGGFGTATGYYCPYELNDSCPHEEGFEECEGGCECFENKLAVFEDCIECITVYEDNTVVFLINCGSVSFEDFGKTVFLTREEAEAALKEMEK